MKEKIKNFISKVILWIKCNRCYSKMEGRAIAVFGMCSGECIYIYNGETKQNKVIPQKLCSVCPYFRALKEREKE